MKKIFSFATGNIWRWNDAANRAVLLDTVCRLDISGVEITFSDKQELYDFNLSRFHQEWLKSLDYVTIHAPFSMCDPEFDRSEIIQQFEILSDLYHRLDAKNVIIHPESDLFESDLLQQCDFRVSTENLPRQFNVGHDDLARYLDRFPTMGLCLDVAHAYYYGKHETKALIDLFGDRISQVHFSGTYRRRDHQSLKTVSRDFLFSIQPVKNLDVPIVIEEDMDVASVETISDEINYIKSLFEM